MRKNHLYVFLIHNATLIPIPKIEYVQHRRIENP